MKEPTVRVDQALHGYSDGHRLLAASKELPRAARHTLDELSDMSGRSIVQGFQEYLTGYPIPGTTLYAFAKTWYAPEFERPGCVWTHTLLVDVAELGVLPNPSVLLGWFKRPHIEAVRRESYRSPLQVPAVPRKAALCPDIRVAAAVLACLYAGPSMPVLIAAPAAELGQDLVLSIWDQQWPALRATFSFCTGAISPRSLSGTPLDLQVIPPTALREARRLREASIVEPADLDAAHAPWLSIAVSDLSDSAGSAFREFLWRNAHGVVDHRELFASLAQLWFATADTQPSLIELLKTISEQHPGPSEGRALKRALFRRVRFFWMGCTQMPTLSKPCEVLLAPSGRRPSTPTISNGMRLLSRRGGATRKAPLPLLRISCGATVALHSATLSCPRSLK